jgi:ANTAR domain
MSQTEQANTDGAVAPAYALVRALQQENEQLRHALESRVVIEQAKGAVSARCGLLPEEAFELIRGLARSQRRRIHDLAAEIVRNQGRLDGVEGDGHLPLTSTATTPSRVRRTQPKKIHLTPDGRRR